VPLHSRAHAPMPAAARARRSGAGAGELLRRHARRLLDPRDAGAAVAVAAALCAAEALLCALIIRRVPYTEIDWQACPSAPSAQRAGLTRLPQAYMQEVGGFLDGERDYTKLRGDTGASRHRFACSAGGAE